MEQLGLEAVAMSETGRAAAAHRWLGFDGRAWNRGTVVRANESIGGEPGGGEMGVRSDEGRDGLDSGETGRESRAMRRASDRAVCVRWMVARLHF